MVVLLQAVESWVWSWEPRLLARCSNGTKLGHHTIENKLFYSACVLQQDGITMEYVRRQLEDCTSQHR